MTQRNNHSQFAIAKPQGQGVVLRAAPALIGYATLVALITVLVLITGSTSAEYGFA